MAVTLVEFFDKTAAESIISPLTMLPDKIILVGEKYGMEAQGERMLRLLRRRGQNAEIEYRVITRSEVKTVLAVLEEILAAETDVVFDLTGGEDLALFAAGQIFERHREKKPQFHWFNVRTGQVKDCDMDGEKIAARQPELSVDELVALQGGRVIYDREKPDTSHLWPADEEFGRDIEAMWEICAADCAAWNRQLQMLNEIDRYRDRTLDPLITQVSVQKVWPILVQHYGTPDLQGVFNDLEARGLFTEYILSEDFLRIRYKNQAVQQALGKAGTALELMTWHLARTLVYRDRPVYTDARTGVYIDWDGVLHGQYDPDTDNEIDVLLMKGMVPFFISCKNGTIDTEELYKVHTVAERFGGPYARKVLICTTWGSLNERKQATLKDRAREMGIFILEGAHRLTKSQFADALRKLDDWTLHVK